MWRRRLDAILSAPFELLALQPSSSKVFRGRYLRIRDNLFGIGPLIAQGAEAMVFELIDLEEGLLVGVAKVCRFSPGTPEYKAWAVPYRLERNRASAKPDVEMQPAVLHEVPGGLIKLQDYLSHDPSVDWSTTYPANPVFTVESEEGPEGALQCAEELISRHGEKGILVEAKGRILSNLGRWEEAREALSTAFKAYTKESFAGVLRAGVGLAHAHQMIYQAQRWTDADAVFTIEVPDGPRVSTVVYGDPKASALEDSLEDKTLYVLFEVLNQEPCFVPALLALAEHFSGNQMTWDASIQVLDAIERFDPRRRDVEEYKERLQKHYRLYFEHLASIAASTDTAESCDEEVTSASPRVGGGLTTPSVPDSTFMRDFDDAYRPEPTNGQLARARYEAVWANLASRRYEEAKNAASAAMELDAGNVEYPLALAQVLKAMGQHARSCDVLRETTIRFADRPEPFLALGDLHLEQEEPEMARVAFLRAARLELSSHWRTDMGLGQAYRMLQDRTRALEYLRRAYTNAPDNSDSEMGVRRISWKAYTATLLAYALRDERGGATVAEKTEALRVIDVALKSHPDESYVLVSRAQSLYLFGRFEEAVAELSRAVELDPDHPVAAKLLSGLRDQMKENGSDKSPGIADNALTHDGERLA